MTAKVTGQLNQRPAGEFRRLLDGIIHRESTTAPQWKEWQEAIHGSSIIRAREVGQSVKYRLRRGPHAIQQAGNAIHFQILIILGSPLVGSAARSSFLNIYFIHFDNPNEHCQLPVVSRLRRICPVSTRPWIFTSTRSSRRSIHSIVPASHCVTLPRLPLTGPS